MCIVDNSAQHEFNEVCFLLDFDNCVSICGDVEKKGSTGKVCMIKHKHYFIVGH